MADFRIKLITLAGAAAMFAGMAQAQLTVTCTAATATTSSFVRAESNDDQVGDTLINCNNTGGAATINLQLFMSPSVNITSATVGTGNGAKNETLAGITPLPAGGGAPAAYGSVSGNSVSFSGIAAPAGAGPFTITITNIKIQASSIGAPTGVPTAIAESIFVSGTGVNNNVLTANNVAFVTNGLGGIKAAGISGINNNAIPNNSICQQIGAGTENFDVQYGESFATAFKTQGSNATNTTANSWFLNNTETGFGVAVAGGTNTATSGTRVSVTFANVPTGVSVYVPLVLNDTVKNAPADPTAGQMTLVTSATGPRVDAVASVPSSNAPPAGSGLVTITNGSGTAVYEYTRNDPGTIEKYKVVVYLRGSAGAVTAPSGAITATVSFAPIGSASSVPNFVSGSSTATVNGSNFIACNSTLLFPFVTNQLGFDTGLAISNTSTDNLKADGTSNAAKQSGVCVLNFYGASAPAAVTTASIATGTTYAAAASSLAPGFQGYLIANCNFLYGHGFAYVVYNLTQNNGAAMGYLASVINNDRTSPVPATGAAGSNNPESAGN